MQFSVINNWRANKLLRIAVARNRQKKSSAKKKPNKQHENMTIKSELN